MVQIKTEPVPGHEFLDVFAPVVVRWQHPRPDAEQQQHQQQQRPVRGHGAAQERAAAAEKILFFQLWADDHFDFAVLSLLL